MKKSIIFLSILFLGFGTIQTSKAKLAKASCPIEGQRKIKQNKPKCCCCAPKHTGSGDAVNRAGANKRIKTKKKQSKATQADVAQAGASGEDLYLDQSIAEIKKQIKGLKQADPKNPNLAGDQEKLKALEQMSKKIHREEKLLAKSKN